MIASSPSPLFCGKHFATTRPSAPAPAREAGMVFSAIVLRTRTIAAQLDDVESAAAEESHLTTADLSHQSDDLHRPRGQGPLPTRQPDAPRNGRVGRLGNARRPHRRYAARPRPAEAKKHETLQRFPRSASISGCTFTSAWHSPIVGCNKNLSDPGTRGSRRGTERVFLRIAPGFPHFYAGTTSSGRNDLLERVGIASAPIRSG